MTRAEVECNLSGRWTDSESSGKAQATYITTDLIQVVIRTEAETNHSGRWAYSDVCISMSLEKELGRYKLNPPTDSCYRLPMSKRSLGLEALVENCFTNGFSKRRTSDLFSNLSFLGGNHSTNEHSEGNRLVDLRNNLKEGTASS